MIDPEVQKLLTLQERDMKKMRLEAELNNIPDRISGVESAKRAAEEEFDSKKSRLRALEVERKSLENSLATTENQITKYKNQQLIVKKNEEYQALTHEIERAQQEASGLMDHELEVMMAIDEEKKVVASLESTLADRLASFDQEIGDIRSTELNLRAELKDATSAYEHARSLVSDRYLRAYEQAKRSLKNRPPFVAPIEGGMCRRSNLKVSQEAIEEARIHGTPHFDDVTGCVVYID